MSYNNSSVCFVIISDELSVQNMQATENSSERNHRVPVISSQRNAVTDINIHFFAIAFLNNYFLIFVNECNMSCMVDV